MKVPFTVRLDPDLVDQLRITVVELQREDPTLTLGGYVTAALHQALANPQPLPIASGKAPRRGPRITPPPASPTSPAGPNEPGDTDHECQPRPDPAH